MTNSKSTKRALLSSVLALLICATMLIGTTFAWFTDSVTSGGNKIVAGNLDIDLYLWNDATNSVEITGESAPIFGSAGLAQNSTNTLWEPGKTQVVYLSLKNNGSLDLKYNVAVDVKNPVDGKDLYKAMQYDIIENAKFDSVTAWTNGVDVVEGINTTQANDVVLGAGDEHFFALAIHMKESAGNEYQNGQVNFDIRVLATQLASEYDSFDNQYDVDADYVAEVKTAAELATALRAGGLVKLANDISVTESLTVPAGVTVNLDLNGKTITGKNTTSDGAVINNKGTLTIAGGTVENTTVNGAEAIANSGTMVLKDVTVNGAPMATTGYPAYAVGTSGKLTIEEGTKVYADRGALRTSDGAELIINGGEFIVSDAADGRNMMNHVVYAYGANTTVTINDGYFEYNHTSTGGASVVCPYYATIIVNGGDFRDVMDDNNWTSVGNFQNYMGTKAPVVYGGTYDDKTHTKWLASGYVSVENGDGTYTVIKGVTNVTELTAAIQKGGKVVLTDDIELTKNLMPTKDVVIDLNGNTIKTTASTSLFQSQSNAHPNMIITSSKAGAVIDATNSTFSSGIVHSYGKTEIRNVTINAGSNKVVQVQGTYGSVEIYDTVINVDSGNPFNVLGDLTLGEGTVVNVTNLNSSFISNSGKHNIVIDGAKINVDKFRVNGGAMISLASGTTLALKNTEVKVGLDTTYTSYFISKAENATIENCTFDIKEYAGTKEYDIEFVPDANVGAKYAWKQK